MACMEDLRGTTQCQGQILKLACFSITCRACEACDGLKHFRSVICCEAHLV